MPLAAAGVATALLAWLVSAMFDRAPEAAGVATTGVALTVVAVPVLSRTARRDGRSGLFPVMLVALGAKLAATLVQFAFLGTVFDLADSQFYDDRGRAAAVALATGQPLSLSAIPGSGFIEWLTGVTYLVTGPSLQSAYLVFSVLGFGGQLLALRAFRIALPDVDPTRYTLLILFAPSLLFWTSSLGKDAWMLLMLGATCHGAACLFAHRRGGLVGLGLGLGGAALVRPHIAVLVLVAILVAYLLAPGGRASAAAPLVKAGGTVVLLGGLVAALRQLQTFLGAAALDPANVNQSLDLVSQRSTIGGSSFTGAAGRSVTDIPAAVVSVLFRPWPWEAASPLMLAAAAEGLVLLVLAATLLVGSRGTRLWGSVRQRPYLVFASVYSLLFCLAFSNLGNFGLLVRERIQVIPLVLVLLSLVRRKPQPAENALTGRSAVRQPDSSRAFHSMNGRST